MTVAAVLSIGPTTPAREVTCAYTYHVPDGNLAKGVHDWLFSRYAERTSGLSPALLVRSARSDDAP